MSSKNNRQFYRRDGKPLDRTIESLKLAPTSEIHIDMSVFNSESEKSDKSGALELIGSILDRIRLPRITIELPQINPKFMFKWIALSTASFSLAAGVFLAIPKEILPEVSEYSIYSSKPLTMENMSYDVYTKDSRSQKINEIFKLYDCPLEGMGEVFVHEADENDIPWWIVASIAFQESSCGKNSPKVDGYESYNAWGWAVYGENVHVFDNWARGIETVSKYLSNKFYSQGITETCEIMQIYTPPSNGSWCEGVEHFRDLFENYKSPNYK